jgi:hypothetical protein
MKFFIPNVSDQQETQAVYEKIVKLIAEETGCQVTPHKIFILMYRYHQYIYEVEVGKIAPFVDEIVIAILESPDLCFICTETHGVSQGIPVLVGRKYVLRIVYFDN